MTPTPTLRLVPLGSARTLTRDGAGIQYLEFGVRNGKFPTLG